MRKLKAAAAPSKAGTSPVEVPVSASAFRLAGGSSSERFNLQQMHLATQCIWLKSGDNDENIKRVGAAIDAMAGIAPKDEIEGMLAAHMVALHHAAMECMGRAMIPDQTFVGRSEALKHAAKLTRAYGGHMEALGRYRGKGQQTVRVEHVHVHSGGQAIVGAVTGGGPGASSKSEDQPYAKTIAHAPVPQMRSADPTRERVPVASGGG